jgi:hypothetical protein
VQIECDLCCLSRNPGISADRCNDGFAEHRRCEREPADRQAAEHNFDRQARYLEIFGPRRCRRRGGFPRHIHLGEAQRPNMEPAYQQFGC